MNVSKPFESSAEALAALFSAFPTDKGEGPAFAATYLIAIDGYSLKALDGAVRRVIRGEADGVDMRFLPTPAQIGNLVGYMEKLYAPTERREALPAPGDAVRTEEEQQRIDSFIDRWREANGMQRKRGEITTDREAVPKAKLAELDRAVKAQADRIAAEGLPKLSEEALAIFRESAERAAPTPAEQFDEWDRRQPTPTIQRNEEKAA